MNDDESKSTPEPSSAPAEAAELQPDAVAADIVADAPKATPSRAGDPAPKPEAAASAKNDAAGSGSADVDSAGVPFDPAKHNKTKNRHTGRWMPKGGRKPKTAKPATLPSAESAWSDAERSAARGDVPAVDSPESPESTGKADSVNTSDIPNDVPRSSPDQMGEVAANILQTATGAITGEPDEAKVTGKEHEEMKGQFASVVRWKGWHVTGWAAVLMTVVFYASRVVSKPKTSSKISNWWTRVRSDAATPVEPTEPPKNTAPQPARRPPPAPAAPRTTPAPGEFDHLKNLGA